ncbi:S9 family peptidase, partial [Rhodobacteraceae bacterium 4F10]
MKKHFLLLAIALSVVACKMDKKDSDKAIITLKKYSIEQMMDNENVFGGSFSPDNSKLLVTSNRSGIYNMYTVSTSGGELEPITKSDSSSVFATSYFPKDERMLFRMDNNGDEIYHIFLRELNGYIKDLTPTKGARASFFGWAKDEKSFFFTSNKRDNRFMDLYEMDLETFTPKMIYENKEGYNVSAISNNKNMLALSKTVNTNDSDLFLFDRTTKVITKINLRLSGNSAADFSIDDTEFYYTTDAEGEFATLMKYTISTNETEKVLAKDWDISGSYFTNNGSYRVTYINEDAKNVIEVYDVKAGKNIELPNVDGKSITSVGFSRDESMMRFYAGGSNTPSNLYVYDLKTKKQTQLTDVLNKEINPEDL